MLFDAKNTIVDGPRTIDRAVGLIAFENVNFAYPDGHVALEDVYARPSSPARGSPSSGARARVSRPCSTCCPGSTTRPGADHARRDRHTRADAHLLRDQIGVVSQDFGCWAADRRRRTSASGGATNAGPRSRPRRVAAAVDGFIPRCRRATTRRTPSAAAFSGGERQRLDRRAILRDAPSRRATSRPWRSTPRAIR